MAGTMISLFSNSSQLGRIALHLDRGHVETDREEPHLFFAAEIECAFCGIAFEVEDEFGGFGFVVESPCTREFVLSGRTTESHANCCNEDGQSDTTVKEELVPL